MAARFLTTALAISLAACGGGSVLDPGAGNDPGGGTNTLFVEGRVSAGARATNARTAAEFDTEFSIRITLNNLPVTTGTVTITSNTGTFPLVFNPDGDQSGRWVGQMNGYDEVYILDAESGMDNVHDIRVDGPDIHTFKAPLAGATVDTTMPLEVDWSRDDTAAIASIDTERLDRLSIPDSGEYMLAAGTLKAEKDQAVTNTIRIERTDLVTPSGAVAGSEFSVRLTNDIEVVAAPNPAL